MESMHLYKRGKVYWVRFKDGSGTWRRMRAATNKQLGESFGRKVAGLAECAAAACAVPDQLIEWAMNLDDKRRSQLVKWGMLNERRLAASMPLTDQVDEWHAGMLNRGRGEGYADTCRRRVNAINDACGFTYWRDIDAERVLSVMDDWRRDGSVPGSRRKTTVSEWTLRHYLVSYKSFCTWMVRSDMAPKSPMIAVRAERRRMAPTASPSNMARRRALNNEEQAALVGAAANGATIYGMAGQHRATLYRLALRTGLRSSAIRRLRAKDISDTGWVMARSGGARNKQTTPKPIHGAIIDELLGMAEGLAPDDPLFNLPYKTSMARMVRRDAKAAGIDLVGVDFHCLRHSFGTTLARQGVHPKTLMSLMDHSDINVTMRLYAHSMPGDEVDSIAAMPDLNTSHVTKRATLGTKTA